MYSSHPLFGLEIYLFITQQIFHTHDKGLCKFSYFKMFLLSYSVILHLVLKSVLSFSFNDLLHSSYTKSFLSIDFFLFTYDYF